MIEPSRRIVLTGFMGAGKSTVAESLASHFDCRMIDLDALIAGREGRSITDIIDEDGEPRFREIETRALHDALEYKNAQVIALGGGTWTLEHNRALIESYDCFTVWLDAPFELCWQRISSEVDLRPLARDRENARQLYEFRKSSYALAKIRIEVDRDVGSEELSAGIVSKLP